MNSILKPPSYGHWRHSNGVICCGTIRVFSVDIDTCPSKDVEDKWLDWVCDVLNREVSNRDLFEEINDLDDII